VTASRVASWHAGPYSPRVAKTDYLADALAALEQAGRRRGRRVLGGPQGAHVVVDGRDVVSFSSNDYLGLAAHPALREAAHQAIDRWGVGAGASRLVVGNSGAHVALEEALAAWGGRAAALFNSGYAANTGILATMVGPGDAVFSDELNHASLIDGCRLTKASVVVYRHGDAADLARKLEATAARRRVVATESVFSMDGDCVDLRAIAAVADAHGAMLVVDEAHAVGVLGDRGVGAAADIGADVVVGTLGKALGSYGAFVWVEPAVAEWLWNRVRSLVFTTGLPPMVVAASTAAVALVASDEGARLRAVLATRVAMLVDGLRARGIPVRADGGIVPLVVGDDHAVMECTALLLDRGVFVQGIRPPTVPEGTARLRVAVSAAHSEEDVGRLLEGIGALLERGLLSST
jgi:8-amino-7-oxononanoate synthase